MGFSLYFPVPKKSGGMKPILDLRVLNGYIAHLLECIQPGDWMTSIDLTNAYFHVPILPHNRKYLGFAVGGRMYKHCCLPFGYSLAPRTFTKCVEMALASLRERGVRTLTYIDDWLILATSR